MDNEVEKASDTSESEISLNQAFMSITEWNPLEIKIECTEKFQNVLSGEEISDELRKVEDTHLQEDTTDKTDVCDAATIIDDDVKKAQNTVLLQDTREKNHIPDSLDEKKGIATRIFKTCEGLRQKMKRKKADCSPEAAKLPQKRSRRVSEIFKVGDKVMALWVDGILS
ncbi:uncharacterized protein LOC132744345 [Ruditapes philippinarum]|uniref:uncharacterized protein LOC132744345 n=1 Tax=Ruditapes philippinarum TaxID=129788 RepID=UPI00295BC1E7|nr:uncharacterized protein LOC132744345 [Ruditapes philippinarum]